MMKLADLLELNTQPSEEVKMKNFLNRGSRDQADVFTTDHPENTNSSQRYNNGYPWSFDDPSGIFEEDDEDELGFELTPWEILEGSVEWALRKEYGIKDEEFYNLVLETGGSHETNKRKKEGIHIAEYYISLLKKEGYEDVEDLIEVAEDRLPEDFEQMSGKDQINELALALCMDSAYGIVSLVVSDYILLDIRKEDVGLDGNRQVVNKLGATGFTAFSQNETKRFQEMAGIFEEDGADERIHQSLIGREFQTLEDLAKMASRMRQRGFAQSEIEEFVKKYLI